MGESGCLKDAEHLLDVQSLVDSWEVFDNVEAHSLGQRSALANGNDVTFADILEAWRAVNRHVSVLLSKTSVLGEVLKVITTNNHGSLHLVGDDHCLQDSTTDRNIASEWALLVDVGLFDGGLWGLETKSNTLVVSDSLSNHYISV